MIRRLFALVILLAFAAAGLYYWKNRTGGPELPRLPKQVARLQTNLKDAAVTTAVRAAFTLNRATARFDMNVTTKDGVVTLSGQVPDEAARAAAGRVAAAVPEVVSVTNQLETGGAAPASDRSLIESLDDEKLELQVKAAVSLNRELRDLPIAVKAFRGGVTLSGQVPTEGQKALALQVARDTPGVAAVTDGMKVGGHDTPPSH